MISKGDKEVQNFDSIERRWRCSKHIGEFRDFYCRDCRELLCLKCKGAVLEYGQNHRSHEIVGINEEVEEVRKFISRGNYEISETCRIWKNILKGILDMSYLSTEIQEIYRKIFESIIKYQQILDRRKRFSVGASGYDLVKKSIFFERELKDLHRTRWEYKQHPQITSLLKNLETAPSTRIESACRETSSSQCVLNGLTTTDSRRSTGELVPYQEIVSTNLVAPPYMATVASGIPFGQSVQDGLTISGSRPSSGGLVSDLVIESPTPVVHILDSATSTAAVLNPGSNSTAQVQLGASFEPGLRAVSGLR